MRSNEFEKAFSDFLDSDLYDEAENTLFGLMLMAFRKGWIAAGGDAPGAADIRKMLKHLCDTEMSEA